MIPINGIGGTSITPYTEVYSPSPSLFSPSIAAAFGAWGNSVEVAQAVIVADSALGVLATALLVRERSAPLERGGPMERCTLNTATAAASAPTPAQPRR
jgi:hypothetical protein